MSDPLGGALPDKRQVAASFSRAAATYDAVAELQRGVGDSLLARLPAELAVRRWLDLGCGTGHFSRALARRFAEAEGLAVDIAEGMLRHAREHGGAQHFIGGDAERLPLRGECCDLLFSSLAIQWCADLPAVLITADRSNEVRAAAEQMGVPVINKPLKPAVLRSTMTRMRRMTPEAAE